MSNLIEEIARAQMEDRLRAARRRRVSGDAGTLRSRAGQCGSHQFQRPISAITAGTISARITVASRRIPAPRPVANIFRSVPGPEAIETNARKRISAALVTSRPVRPIPSITAVSVEPVRS